MLGKLHPHNEKGKTHKQEISIVKGTVGIELDTKSQSQQNQRHAKGGQAVEILIKKEIKPVNIGNSQQIPGRGSSRTNQIPRTVKKEEIGKIRQVYSCHLFRQLSRQY